MQNSVGVPHGGSVATGTYVCIMTDSVRTLVLSESMFLRTYSVASVWDVQLGHGQWALRHVQCVVMQWWVFDSTVMHLTVQSSATWSPAWHLACFLNIGWVVHQAESVCVLA